MSTKISLIKIFSRNSTVNTAYIYITNINYIFLNIETPKVWVTSILGLLVTFTVDISVAEIFKEIFRSFFCVISRRNVCSKFCSCFPVDTYTQDNMKL